MITQVDIDKFKTMGKVTTKALGESYQATQLSLDYHAQYGKALQLNATAVKACSDWYDYCLNFGKQAKGNNAWFTAAYAALSKIAPAQKALADGRKALFADMAAHATLNFPPSSNPAAAAEEADKQAAGSGRTIPKAAADQKRGVDSLDPTADEPVILNEEMSTGAKVGLFAAAGIALAWIARKVMT